MKKYTNFDDVDRDLKYLRLKRKIHLEEIKFNFHSTKEAVKDTFSPVNMVVNTVSSVARKAFLAKVVGGVVGKIPFVGKRLKRW